MPEPTVYDDRAQTIYALRAEVERLRAMVDTIRYMIDDPDVLNIIDEVCPYNAASDEKPCGRLLVGQGGDTWDPLCVLPAGHAEVCKPASDEDRRGR